MPVKHSPSKPLRYCNRSRHWQLVCAVLLVWGASSTTAQANCIGWGCGIDGDNPLHLSLFSLGLTVLLPLGSTHATSEGISESRLFSPAEQEDAAQLIATDGVLVGVHFEVVRRRLREQRHPAALLANPELALFILTQPAT